MQDGLLPLFPLQVVLFPGSPLPLHIFEDRYKEMIQEVVRDREEFGVVMANGWQASLTVDNTAIPEDQVVVRGQQYLFTPGPGTITGALTPGQHSATVSYYPTTLGPSAAQQFAWSFRVS